MAVLQDVTKFQQVRLRKLSRTFQLQMLQPVDRVHVSQHEYRAPVCQPDALFSQKLTKCAYMFVMVVVAFLCCSLVASCCPVISTAWEVCGDLGEFRATYSGHALPLPAARQLVDFAALNKTKDQ